MSAELYKQIVMAELEDLAARIAANIEKTGQKNTGQTAASLQAVETGSNVFALVGRPGLYGLEIGLNHRPPVMPIYEWIISKGLAKETQKQTMSFAYAITQKMATEGSFLYRNKKTFGGVANPDVYSSEINKTIDNLYEKLGAAVIRAIETITLNF